MRGFCILCAECLGSMNQRIAHIALVVDDYDRAIQYYTTQLDFALLEDTDLGAGKRWVLVAPQGASGTNLLLARAANEAQSSRIGNQTGGRVFLFLHTDDFWRDYHKYQERGIPLVRLPEEASYGTVAVFRDLYGNLWDLIQPRQL